MISYGRQSIDKSDILSVISALKSRNITQGPQVLKFEKVLSQLWQLEVDLFDILNQTTINASNEEMPATLEKLISDTQPGMMVQIFICFRVFF